MLAHLQQAHQAPSRCLDAHSSSSNRPQTARGRRGAARQRQRALCAAATSPTNAERVSRPAGAVSPWAPPQQQKPLPSAGYDRTFSEHYSLDQPLGAGSFKTVFVGRDKRTGERVAVAVIGKERDGADVEHNMQRIKREARASPSHPLLTGPRQHLVLLQVQRARNLAGGLMWGAAPEISSHLPSCATAVFGAAWLVYLVTCLGVYPRVGWAARSSCSRATPHR